MVGARRAGENVRIEVWDTGPGIPQTAQSAIFEEFRRLDELDNTGVRGAGLGLAVARRMADLMGADIGLRSVQGKGSVFHVSLPRALLHGSQGQLTAAPRSRAASVNLIGRRILCVDDEASILDAMSGLIGHWGGEALLARTGAEAMSIARLGRIDAVIVDHQLADGETGIDVLAGLVRVRGNLPPAALLTANRTESVRAAAIAFGARVLYKPAEPGALHDFLIGATTPAAAE